MPIEDVNKLVRLYELAAEFNSLDPSFAYSLVLDLEKGGGRLTKSCTTQKGAEASIVMSWENIAQGVEKIQGTLDTFRNHLSKEKESFFKKIRSGGAIVSTKSCSEQELIAARITNRFFVDEDGFEYVWHPQDWLNVREKAYYDSFQYFK